LRLFFALLPDEVTKKSLYSEARRLEMSGRARQLALANFHITLAFVGEVPESSLHRFRQIGASLALRQCVIGLDLYEYWPKPQVLVLTARNNPQELSAQSYRLQAAVGALVHPGREDKPWRVHVTLARKVAQAPVLTTMSPIHWASHSFCLMRSKTDGRESVYTVVDSWPLLDKA
jgi:RNA 2',3'-cyclic 3'-phosphodiesterase